MNGANRFFRASGAVAALLALSMATTSAHADDKIVCANASENGQKLRDDGKLMKARQEFLVCARDVCPQIIKRDCVDWLQKSEESLPTVVLGAKDSKGQDVIVAHVTFDGAPLADRLDGKAVFVDPGQHTFRFEIPGEKPIEQQMVIHEGEKNRLVSVSLAPAAAPPPSGGGDNHFTPPPPEPEQKKSKVPAFIVGGLGLATVAAGGVFYFLALSNYNDLKDGCGKTHSCTDSDTSPVQTKADVSYVLLGVGGALVITGVVLYVLESGSSSATVTTGKKGSNKIFGIEKFGFAPVPGGGGAAVFGTSF